MERIFNGIYLAAAMIVGVTFGFLMAAPLVPGIPPDQTLTVAAAVIAALGTWAVGFGAMHFAEASHKLRLAEIQKTEHGEFVHIRSQLVNCRLAITVYDTIIRDASGGTLTLESRHTALRAILSLIPAQPVGTSQGFREKERARAQAIDVAAAMLRVGATQFMERYPVGVAHRTTDMNANFDHVIEQLRSLSRQAMDLGKLQDAARGITGVDSKSSSRAVTIAETN